jgi:hypothetical protein
MSGEKYKEFEVKTSSEAINVLLELRRHLFVSFRGQRDNTWSLGPHWEIPASWKNKKKEVLAETDLNPEMKRREDDALRDLDDPQRDIYWKSKSIRRGISEHLMQYLRHTHLIAENRRNGFPFENCWWSNLIFAHHHGLKSLLLDWTSNPLVALYFAVENILSKGNESKRGAVYALKVEEAPSDPKEKPHKTRWFDFDAVRKQYPFGEFCPYWIMVNPSLNTDRIARQSGKFTYHPSTQDRELVIGSGTEAVVKVDEGETLIKIVVGTDEQHNPTNDIRTELGIMNIHHGSLFPDFDGFASYVNEEWRTIATPPNGNVCRSPSRETSNIVEQVREFVTGRANNTPSRT